MTGSEGVVVADVGVDDVTVVQWVVCTGCLGTFVCIFGMERGCGCEERDGGGCCIGVTLTTTGGTSLVITGRGRGMGSDLVRSFLMVGGSERGGAA